MLVNVGNAGGGLIGAGLSCRVLKSGKPKESEEPLRRLRLRNPEGARNITLEYKRSVVSGAEVRKTKGIGGAYEAAEAQESGGRSKYYVGIQKVGS
ncbi:hypothetical protein NDU88_003800 [Pleurodeles waltl]|uniref:Uncharacterized protein n=1 Tax=Pleurodeles waltl TaxID=8319 RepID=A0AAV7WSA9_PLEWA|nr:hypothetical protein NDU88_003800 [Pleurodeles waltl]